ncbi:hypothetical protein E2651_11835 [Streptomyces sp. MZ04]|nr:hypothetical protein E2651_11835 [Streptomyces sp. MZ04]
MNSRFRCPEGPPDDEGGGQGPPSGGMPPPPSGGQPPPPGGGPYPPPGGPKPPSPGGGASPGGGGGCGGTGGMAIPSRVGSHRSRRDPCAEVDASAVTLRGQPRAPRRWSMASWSRRSKAMPRAAAPVTSKSSKA